MKSLDTNILLYAANSGTSEHAKAALIVDDMLQNPADWMIADQVLWEFYKALRNPKILQKPRTAAQAAEQVEFLRVKSGVAHCAYNIESFHPVLQQLGNARFPYQRTHDAVLTVTLRHHGVKCFYTRNVKDFADSGFQKLVNPID